MKLAQALSLRKSQNQMLNNLLEQIKQNAFSGDYDPNELIAKYQSLAWKQVNLINAINNTNTVTLVDGISLSVWRIKRDNLVEMSIKLNSLPRNKKSQSYSRDVLPEENKIDLVKLNVTINDFARQGREIDDLIQSTNWTTDLIGFE